MVFGGIGSANKNSKRIGNHFSMASRYRTLHSLTINYPVKKVNNPSAGNRRNCLFIIVQPVDSCRVTTTISSAIATKAKRHALNLLSVQSKDKLFLKPVGIVAKTR
jgi:hypothetical protein